MYSNRINYQDVGGARVVNMPCLLYNGPIKPKKNFFSVSSGTRSSSNNKLLHPLTSNISSSNFYFNRFPRLWNSLPSVDDDVSTSVVISRMKALFWSHFLLYFNNDDPCSYHFLCPCSSCAYSSRSLPICSVI